MSYEQERALLKGLRRRTSLGYAVTYADCIYHGIKRDSIARAGDDGVIDVVLWGMSLGKLRPQAPSHYRDLATRIGSARQ